MSEQKGFHVTTSQIIQAISAIGIPVVGLIVTIVIFSTNIKRDIGEVKSDVQNIKDDVKGLHRDVSGLHGALDTLKNRQEQYHWENKIYQAEHKK